MKLEGHIWIYNTDHKMKLLTRKDKRYKFEIIYTIFEIQIEIIQKYKIYGLDVKITGVH
jgi:hypothetical protein